MMWECHRLQSTHFVGVYFFVFIAWQLLVSVYQNPCLYLKKNACLWLTTQFCNVRMSSFAIHTHSESLFSSPFIAWQQLESVYQFPCLYLEKLYVIVCDPHALLESIFSSLLPGNYLYLFTNFHACILKMQVCGKRPHFKLCECHHLKSTHIIRVYFFVFIA